MKARTIVPLSAGDSRRAVARFGRAPRTRAVPLLPPDADEQTWLDARRQGPDGYRIGASEIAAVLSLSPWSSPFSLWWQKYHGWQTTQTRSQRWGHKLEAVVGEVFAEDHPDLLLCRAGAALWQHPDHPLAVCSPDFLAVVADDQGVHVEPVEAKSDRGGKGWGPSGSNIVPTHHRVQLLWQCAIFGAPRGHLVRNDVPYVIEYDDDARAEVAGWLDRAEEFVNSLDLGIPPDVDGHKATERALLELNPVVDEGETAIVPGDLATEYEVSHDRLKHAERAFAKAQNRVRAAMGRAEMAMTPRGRVFAKRSVHKRAGYEVGPTVVDQLRRKQEKEQTK